MKAQAHLFASRSIFQLAAAGLRHSRAPVCVFAIIMFVPGQETGAPFLAFDADKAAAAHGWAGVVIISIRINPDWGGGLRERDGGQRRIIGGFCRG